MNISMVIVDDDVLVTSLLSGFLSGQTGITIDGVFNNGKDLIAEVESGKLHPDVIIMDYRMQEMTGCEVTEVIKSIHPSIHIIMMSSHYNITFMGFMLKTGVSAFIPKGISPEELVTIIKEVAIKGFFFMPEQLEVIRRQVSSKSPKPSSTILADLSEREIEVIRLIAHQKTAKEIGDVLFISQRTVEGHKNNLFIKTGAKNIAGLVIFAIQNNIILPEDLPVI